MAKEVKFDAAEFAKEYAPMSEVYKALGLSRYQVGRQAVHNNLYGFNKDRDLIDFGGRPFVSRQALNEAVVRREAKRLAKANKPTTTE